MSDNFKKALAYTFGNEGGYDNHPADHGGATNLGITRSELSRWLGHPASIEEVKNLPRKTAEDIYFRWYWTPLSCDKIESDIVAICMFDIGVVRGIGVPPKYAQRICNANGKPLVVDGHIGPKTLAAVNSLDPAIFVRDFSHLAESGFRAIVANNPSQQVFLRGWVRRAQRLITLLAPKVSQELA